MDFAAVCLLRRVPWLSGDAQGGLECSHRLRLLALPKPIRLLLRLFGRLGSRASGVGTRSDVSLRRGRDRRIGIPRRTKCEDSGGLRCIGSHGRIGGVGDGFGWLLYTARRRRTRRRLRHSSIPSFRVAPAEARSFFCPAKRLTRRCSERLPAVRSTFKMATTFHLHATLAPGSRR